MLFRTKLRRKKKIKVTSFFLFLNLIFIFFCFWTLNKKILDEILIQSESIINNKINLAVNHAVTSFIKTNKLTTKKFYCMTDHEGQVNFFSANNMLIDELCCKLAVYIPEKFLQDKTNSRVTFCLGSLIASVFGINFFNFGGPEIKIRVCPIGNALVDYETRFVSAGINQTNFQVWLKVKFNSQIISPFNKKKFVFTKRIFLVNTIINGQIPQAYILPK